jgi:hypothetical protein
VLSAVLSFLAVHIRHQSSNVLGNSCALPSSNFGIVNIGKTIVKGDHQIEEVDSALAESIQEFNSALSTFGHSVGFRTYQVASQSLEVGTRTLEMVQGKAGHIHTDSHL